MNVHDSEKIAGVLKNEGFREGEIEEADVILLNTCSVRKKAGHKIFARLGRLKPLKEENPDLLIGVCGCVAQHLGEKIFQKAPYVDIVMGPRGMDNLPELIEQNWRGEDKAIDLKEYEDCMEYDFNETVRDSSNRAFVTIMEGCDNYCSYCIVPYTRGGEVSRDYGEILDEVENLAEDGFPEIHLLGQNVNSYEWEGKTFSELLKDVSAVDKIKRIRFITSHPAFFDDSIIEIMAEADNICNTLHLPAQSGSTRVLKKMNRKYTRSDYLETVEKLRRAVPDISLSTDMIVGFPGEREEDFRESLTLLEEVGYDWMFSFKYSPRSKTRAAGMEPKIEEKVKARRLDELQELQKEIQRERFEDRIGNTEEILVEGKSKRGDTLCGRNEANIVVNFPGESSLRGTFVDVEITEAYSNSLAGKTVS